MADSTAALSDLADVFFKQLNGSLSKLNLEFPPPFEKVEGLPIVFVVGLPRSGTTVVQQVLCRALPFGYINNIIARFWSRPSIGIRLSTELGLFEANARRAIGLNSFLGQTYGAVDPHEFGYFWKEFFEFDKHPNHRVPCSDHDDYVLPATKKRWMEKEILGHFGRPLIFKNLTCGMNADLLARIFPASIFVDVRRNPEDVVRSIYRSRLLRNSDDRSWFSLMPSSYPFSASCAEPIDQIIRQMRDCRADIDDALARAERAVVEVNYESFCDDPAATVREVADQVANYVDESFLPIAGNIPNSLTKRASDLLEPSLEKQLTASGFCPGTKQ